MTKYVYVRDGKLFASDDWVTLQNGVRVELDGEGNISKGPSALKGRNMSDLKGKKADGGKSGSVDKLFSKVSSYKSRPSDKPETVKQREKNESWGKEQLSKDLNGRKINGSMYMDPSGSRDKISSVFITTKNKEDIKFLKSKGFEKTPAGDWFKEYDKNAESLQTKAEIDKSWNRLVARGTKK